MDQLLQSARIITTISEMQQTIETIQSQLLAMRMSGADLGLLKDALGILGDCESELCAIRSVRSLVTTNSWMHWMQCSSAKSSASSSPWRPWSESSPAVVGRHGPLLFVFFWERNRET